MKKLFSYVLGIGVMICACAAAWLCYKHVHQRINLENAQQKITQLERLVLFEQKYRTILTIDNTQKILGIAFPTSHLLLAVPYKVQYGVDLQKGFALTSKGQTLVVHYPKPQLLHIDVVHEEIETFCTEGRIRIADFMPAIEKEKTALKTQIDHKNEPAIKINLEKFFTQLLAPLGYQHIEFKELSA